MLLLETMRKLERLASELKAIPGIESAIGLVACPRRKLRDHIKDPDLLRVSGRLFQNGHHARSVEEAFKYLNNLVKSRSGLEDLDGSALMKTAFSAKNPRLRLNTGATQSEHDEQLGYMEVMAGVMSGIRNPRAHDHEWEDSEEHALQMLVLADHLVERAKMAAVPVGEA